MLRYDPETEQRTLDMAAKIIEAKADKIDDEMGKRIYDAEDRKLIVGTYKNAAALVRSLIKPKGPEGAVPAVDVGGSFASEPAGTSASSGGPYRTTAKPAHGESCRCVACYDPRLSKIVLPDGAALLTEAKAANERANTKDKQLVEARAEIARQQDEIAGLQEAVDRLQQVIDLAEVRLPVHLPTFGGVLELVLGAARPRPREPLSTECFAVATWRHEGAEKRVKVYGLNMLIALVTALAAACDDGYRI